ncbi:MAG: redoxin domain-containing protein [Firmicutes bacterium]|nr:redoxin domain-containing protein [Dethiobacter sp.]MBS3888451.1 redoxin domain-containing protein [Bacillota bacterium]MBS4055063.1 redoxin domain-containing protein [Thermaerobacter sp.]
MPNIGEKAPNFTLPGTHGEFDLAAALAKGPLVLIFYPKDNTPG